MLNNIKLRLPLKHISVTQPWGVNFVNFYQKMKMKGHNGIDFKAWEGCNVYSANDGVVIIANTDDTGGKEIRIWNKEGKYSSLYYHLSEMHVEVGDKIVAGQKIGLSGNTGKYTTGAHLHFSIKQTDNKGNTINLDNGYKGCVDCSSFFCYNKDGVEFNPKDLDESTSYHRYWRWRPKGWLWNETKVLWILTKKWIIPNSERINALVYGWWDLPTVMNPSARELWAFIKKDEYTRKEFPFI